MSIQAIAWAWSAHCPNSSAKFVLAFLANCIPRWSNHCNPAVQTICQHTQLNVDTVRKSIRLLVEAGLLIIQRQETDTGRQISNRYVLPEIFVHGTARQADSSPTIGGVAPPDLGPVEAESPPTIGGVAPPDLGGPLREERKEEVSKEESIPPIIPPIDAADDAFERFWERYPRKDAKVAARKLWRRATRTVHPETIIGGLERYPFADEARFVPMPTTWLSQERWEPVTIAVPAKRDAWAWAHETLAATGGGL